MRAVNLLPRDAAGQGRITQEQIPAVVGAGLGVLVVAVLALSFLSSAGQVRDAQSQLADVNSQLAATPKPAAPVTPLNADLAGEHSARVAAVTTALDARLAWDRILREFSLVLPNDVWLTSLNMTNPDPAQTGTVQNNFSLSGYTYSHDSVARLLARLALIPELTGINLTNSTRQDAAGSTTGSSSAKDALGAVQFNITAAVKLPPGATSVAPPPPVVAPVSTDTTSTDGTGS